MKKALLVLLLPALLSCSQAFQNNVSPLPPDLNTASLPQISKSDDGNLILPKTALEKEFLLQASFTDTSGLSLSSPQFFGTQSRIVYFKKQNGALFMMESNKGLFSSDELPAEWILTQFKIAGEDDQKIIFDFNEGMKNLFVTGDWYSSDDEQGRPPLLSVQAPNAFLKEVKTEANRIVIRQTAQLQISNGLDFLIPAEITYTLENYNPDPDFKPMKNPGFERFGFFEANPVVRPEFGTEETYLTRWSLKKPIVYAISDNTPKEFVDAIKEGVLYWNKAFGAEMVQVQMAPAGVRAPDPDYNVIQWITNHTAGFAYADAQMDPRTGEILHAQIYLTSTFTAPMLSEFRQMEKTEEETSDATSLNLEAPDPKKNLKKIFVGLKNFSNGLLCEYPSESDAEGAGADPISLKMTKDFLRHVVAHEVGHTLGLRHNFAGSNYSELLPRAIDEKFTTYLKTGEVDLKEKVGSSVMDYLTLPDRILNGKYIGDPNGGALPYDAMAIAAGYYGASPVRPLEETLFCPDTLAGRYDDCRRFDGSSHPLLSAAEAFKEKIEKLPNTVAQIFLEAKTNFDPELRMPVGNVPLTADYFVSRILLPLAKTVGRMKAQVRSLLVQRTIGPTTDVNQEDTDRATVAWIDQAVAKGGGLKNILSIIDQQALYERLKGADQKFETIIESDPIRKEFSPREIAVMKQKAKPFFEKVTNSVVQGATKIFSGEGEKTENHFRPLREIHPLENILANWAEFIITDHAESTPTFDGNLRLLATGILLPTQGPTDDWEKENRAKVLQILLGKLKQRYGESLNGLPETEKAIIQILSNNISPPTPAL